MRSFCLSIASLPLLRSDSLIRNDVLRHSPSTLINENQACSCCDRLSTDNIHPQVVSVDEFRFGRSSVSRGAALSSARPMPQTDAALVAIARRRMRRRRLGHYCSSRRMPCRGSTPSPVPSRHELAIRGLLRQSHKRRVGRRLRRPQIVLFARRFKHALGLGKLSHLAVQQAKRLIIGMASK